MADVSSIWPVRPRPASVSPTATTGSRTLGVVALVGMIVTAWLGLIVSPADQIQGEAVRFLYIHVPTVWVAYGGFFLTALASAAYLVPRLRRRSLDRLAGAAAEVGVLFTGLNIVTGMLWGRITWGVYWQWDARLTTTALMFVMFLGYLAVRRLPNEPVVRSKRAAIVALVSVPNVLIVRWSVDWWDTLHQKASISTTRESEITGEMLAVLGFSSVVFLLVAAWLGLHRYRIIRLEEIREEEGLGRAIAARRAEAATT
jgi:heme exporter protein C